MSAMLAIAVAVHKFADCGPGQWWFVHHPDGFLIECGIQGRAEQIAAEINAGRSQSPDLSCVQATAPLPSTASPEAGDIGSHAKASVEACEVARHDGRAEALADAPDGVELASRLDAGRTASATSERMDVTVVGDESGTLADSSEREPGNPEVGAISSTRVYSGDSRPAARVPLENAATSPAGEPIKHGCQQPGSCRIKIATSALCWQCNDARAKARASA